MKVNFRPREAGSGEDATEEHQEGMTRLCANDAVVALQMHNMRNGILGSASQRCDVKDLSAESHHLLSHLWRAGFAWSCRVIASLCDDRAGRHRDRGHGS